MQCPANKFKICAAQQRLISTIGNDQGQKKALRLGNGRDRLKRHAEEVSQRLAIASTARGVVTSLLVQVLVHAMESGEQPIAKFQHTRKLHCLTSLNDSLWATGSEEGAVLVWDQRTPETPVLSIPQAHRSRVRGLASLANVGELVQSVASASSDGSLRLWDLRNLQASQSAGEQFYLSADLYRVGMLVGWQ